MATKNRHLVLKAGLGVAAIAAAAGTYYFFGKDGKSHRKSAQAWVNNAKRDVLSQVKKLKEVNEKTYNMVAAKVMDKYSKFQKENPETYALLAKEIKSHWPKIKKHLPRPLRKIAAGKAKAKSE